MLKILSVDKYGYGARMGLKPGDAVINMGGYPVTDVLDAIFYEEEAEFDIDYVTKKGDKKHAHVKKDPTERMGLEFEEITAKRCKNKCKFCFVDQLPKGMRETLYVKDDDYRLSFIAGNYVTLTNLTDTDLDRIIRLHLSPIYVSVHATDDEVRRDIVKNPNTLNLMKYIKRLAENGIITHCQIVLCEDINSGNVLKKSLDDLYALYPAVRTVAIVPVGLTGHRQGLCNLKPLSDKCLNETIDMVEKFNEGKEFCFCSDEFYVKAGRQMPSYESYGSFDQIENGVGLVATFNKNVERSLEELKGRDALGKKVIMITGESFFGNLSQVAKKIEAEIKNVSIEVVKIKNDFFGGAITVAGLITGRDLLAQTPRGADLYLIPHNMLKEFEDVFLDGITLKEVRDELGKVAVVDGLGENLVKCLL